MRISHYEKYKNESNKKGSNEKHDKKKIRENLN